MKEFKSMALDLFYNAKLIKKYNNKIEIFEAKRVENDEDSIIIINNNFNDMIITLNHNYIVSKKIKKINDKIYIKLTIKDYENENTFSNPYYTSFTVAYNEKLNEIVEYKGIEYLTRYMGKIYYYNLKEFLDLE